MQRELWTLYWKSLALSGSTIQLKHKKRRTNFYRYYNHFLNEFQLRKDRREIGIVVIARINVGEGGERKDLLLLLVLKVELKEELLGVCVPFRPEFVIPFLDLPTWNLRGRRIDTLEPSFTYAITVDPKPRLSHSHYGLRLSYFLHQKLHCDY